MLLFSHALALTFADDHIRRNIAQATMWCGAQFILGAVVFMGTVDFGGTPRAFASRWPLAIVATIPSALFVGMFLFRNHACSWGHNQLMNKWRLQSHIVSPSMP